MNRQEEREDIFPNDVGAGEESEDRTPAVKLRDDFLHAVDDYSQAGEKSTDHEKWDLIFYPLFFGPRCPADIIEEQEKGQDHRRNFAENR